MLPFRIIFLLPEEFPLVFHLLQLCSVFDYLKKTYFVFILKDIKDFYSGAKFLVVSYFALALAYIISDILLLFPLGSSNHFSP